MGAINKVFADNHINVSGQFLRTDETVGYVVIDIDAAHSELALSKLQEVEGTMRCRILY